jgi:hypothetical protein
MNLSICSAPDCDRARVAERIRSTLTLEWPWPMATPEHGGDSLRHAEFVRHGRFFPPMNDSPEIQSSSQDGAKIQQIDNNSKVGSPGAR